MRRILKNGYFVVLALSALYLIVGIYYLNTLVQASTAIGVSPDYHGVFLANGLLLIGALPYVIFLWLVNMRLSQPAPEEFCILSGGLIMMVMYFFLKWSKHQLGID